jgi:hypothetical protein
MMQFKKLLKHSFLSLHGHSTQYQQRELSLFLCAISCSLHMLIAGPRVQFRKWRRSSRSTSVCTVLRFPELGLQSSVSFVRGLKKPHRTRLMSDSVCCARVGWEINLLSILKLHDSFMYARYNNNYSGHYPSSYLSFKPNVSRLNSVSKVTD